MAVTAADAGPERDSKMLRAVRDRAATELADLVLIDEILVAFSRQGGRMDRLSPMFKSEVDQIRSDLKGVRDRSDGRPADGWETLHQANRDAADVSKRLMAYIGGSLLRERLEQAQTTASGSFNIALALIDELSDVTNITWDRDILPAEREYTATDTGLIHMVFPRLMVWDLPAVVHEFGHYAATRITVGQIAPFKAMRDSGSLGPAAHVEELFADAFATFVGGPAFGCMCAFQRFSPIDKEAVEDTDTHPSHAARVHLILGLLRARSDEVGDPEWDHVTKWVEQTWTSNLEAIGKPTELPAAWQPKLDADVLRRFRDQVLIRISDARYQSWGRAVALAAELDPERQVPLAAAPTDASLRDILNAGWVARLRWPDSVPQIERSVGRLLLNTAMDSG
jgi:hypothetical protein